MPKFKVSDIVSGWSSYLVGDPNDTATAKARALICVGCPHMKKGKVLSLLKDQGLKEVEGTYCGVCGCPLSAAVRSKSKTCPKNKW